MRKIDLAAQIARSFVGCPYVFASTGQECTVTLRKNRAAARPAYADAIYKYCPVLSGKQENCSSCKYNGKREFDCRGLTYIACKEAGLKISSIGASSQYRADDWIEKGTIDKMPADTPCILFKQDKSNATVMQHTGFALGDGYAVDCRGHSAGTVLKAVSSYPWTHYAIPKGAFDEVEQTTISKEETTTTRATIRKGSKGDDVKLLQNALLKLGYVLPKYGADGSFGNETSAALKQFQQNNSLTADGICGPATWARLDALLNDASVGPVTLYNVSIYGLDAETTAYLLECYPGAVATEANS